jgi:hypothetical protein
MKNCGKEAKDVFFHVIQIYCNIYQNASFLFLFIYITTTTTIININIYREVGT